MEKSYYEECFSSSSCLCILLFCVLNSPILTQCARYFTTVTGRLEEFNLFSPLRPPCCLFQQNGSCAENYQVKNELKTQMESVYCFDLKLTSARRYVTINTSLSLAVKGKPFRDNNVCTGTNIVLRSIYIKIPATQYTGARRPALVSS